MLLPDKEVHADCRIVLLPSGLWVRCILTLRKALNVEVSIEACSFGVSNPFKVETIRLAGTIWHVLLFKSQHREVVTGIFQAEILVPDVVGNIWTKAIFCL